MHLARKGIALRPEQCYYSVINERTDKIMNIVLLIALIIAEAVFASVSIAKHVNRKKFRLFRGIANAAELLVFFTAAIFTEEVKPGLRFSGLLILLGVRLAFAGLMIIARRKNGEEVKKTSGIIVSAIMSCLLFVGALMPSFMFADYNGLPTTGEYEVAMTKAILVDESRTEQFETDGSNREVPVYFYYPETDGKEKFPLVVFSHGAFGYYQSNTSTYMELASNGYIVVSTEHPYHSMFTTDTDGKKIIADMGFLNDVMAADALTEAETFDKHSEWMKLRTEDVSFALDSIEKACSDGALNDSWHCDDAAEITRALDMCDCESIGLMGHSLGGATAVALGRTRDDVDAVIDFDGTMLGEVIGVENGKEVINEEAYPLPLLSFNNNEHQRQIDEYKAEGKTYSNTVVLANAKEGYETCFVGTEHMDFTDLPMFSPFLGSMLGTGDIDTEKSVTKMNEITLDFFNSYLKNDGSFAVEESYEFS